MLINQETKTKGFKTYNHSFQEIQGLDAVDARYSGWQACGRYPAHGIGNCPLRVRQPVHHQVFVVYYVITASAVIFLLMAIYFYFGYNERLAIDVAVGGIVYNIRLIGGNPHVQAVGVGIGARGGAAQLGGVD